MNPPKVTTGYITVATAPGRNLELTLFGKTLPELGKQFRYITGAQMDVTKVWHVSVHGIERLGGLTTQQQG